MLPREIEFVVRVRDLCPERSTLTGAPCTLAFGHGAASAERYHDFADRDAFSRGYAKGVADAVFEPVTRPPFR